MHPETSLNLVVTVAKAANTVFQLDADKATLEAGKSGTIGIKAKAGDVTAKVKSGEDVVTLKDLNVTAVSSGTAVIEVTDSGNSAYGALTKEYTVTVTKKAASFKLNATSASMTYGGSTYKIGYTNNAGKVTFTSGRTSVATVSSAGVITAKKPGNATITVKDPGNGSTKDSSLSFKVTVKKADQSVKAAFKSGSTKVGGTAKYTLTGVKTSAPTVTSNKTSVAKISSKSKTAINIKAVKAGTAKITVKVPGNTYYNAKTITFNVKVTAASQTIKVSPTSVSLAKKGATRQLKVTGAKTKVTYKSSNSKIAKVDSKGKITAVKKGKCTITVTAAGTTSYSKATKTVSVTVQK